MDEGDAEQYSHPLCIAILRGNHTAIQVLAAESININIAVNMFFLFLVPEKYAC